MNLGDLGVCLAAVEGSGSRSRFKYPHNMMGKESDFLKFHRDIMKG
jgi:hypothetical protein